MIGSCTAVRHDTCCHEISGIHLLGRNRGLRSDLRCRYSYGSVASGDTFTTVGQLRGGLGHAPPYALITRQVLLHGPRASDATVGGGLRADRGARRRNACFASVTADGATACPRQLAPGGHTRGPDDPFVPAGGSQYGVPGRGAVPMGRPPGMGPRAARHPDTAVPFVLLRRPRHLPADCRAGRQPGGPGRGPGPFPRLHARGHRSAVGRHGPAVRAPGRVLRSRAVRRPRTDVAPGRVRHV